MRTLKVGGIQPDAQKIMVEGQGLFKKAGMERSCVILQSATVAMQFERLAHASGIFAFERYINAAQKPDWEAESRRLDPEENRPQRLTLPQPSFHSCEPRASAVVARRANRPEPKSSPSRIARDCR